MSANKHTNQSKQFAKFSDHSIVSINSWLIGQDSYQQSMSIADNELIVDNTVLISLSLVLSGDLECFGRARGQRL